VQESHTRRKGHGQVAYTLDISLLHHPYLFPGLGPTCSENFASYRKLCAFYRRLL